MTDLVHISAVLLAILRDDPLERLPLLRTGEREPINPAIRYAVWRRDNGCCQWCGVRENLQLDHIVPWLAEQGRTL
jgi:hypothetical protein